MKAPNSSTCASSSAGSQENSHEKVKSYLEVMVKLANQNAEIMNCVKSLINKDEAAREALSEVIKRSDGEIDWGKLLEEHSNRDDKSTKSSKLTIKQSVGLPKKLPPNKLMFELIERGKCDLIIKRNSSFAQKTECIKIVNYIVRRFRKFESPTGGSAYRVDDNINRILKRREKLSRIFPCYGCEKYKCNVSLQFEYERSTGEYKLSRCGQHNHPFDNIEKNAKWDRILDTEEPPFIKILTTKISPPVEIESDGDDGETDLDSPHSSAQVSRLDSIPSPNDSEYELIEHGRCHISERDSSFSHKESYRLLNYIVRRFRNFESPTGGSAYRIANLRITEIFKKDNFMQLFPCYRCKIHRCKAHLLFQYDRSTGEYKLSRCGQHNHPFDNFKMNLKWDQILDTEEPPNIEILTTKIRQPVQNVDDDRSTPTVKTERLEIKN